MGNIQPYYNGTGYGLNFIELLMIYNQMPASQKKAIYDGLEEESPLKKILRSIRFEFSKNTIPSTCDEKLIERFEDSYADDKIFKQLTQMSYPELIKFFIGTIRQNGNKLFERSKKEYIGLFIRILFNKSKQQENDENNVGRKKVSRRKAKKLKEARKKQKINNKTNRENAGLELRGIVNNTREEKETKETLFKHFENKEISIEIEDTFNVLEDLNNKLPRIELEQRNLYINIINYTLENGSYEEYVNDNRNGKLQIDSDSKVVLDNIKECEERLRYLIVLSSQNNDNTTRLRKLINKRDEFLKKSKKNAQDFENSMHTSMQLIGFRNRIRNIQNSKLIYGDQIFNLINSKKKIKNIEDVSNLFDNLQECIKSRIEFFIKIIEKQKNKLDEKEIEKLELIKRAIEPNNIEALLPTIIKYMPELYNIYKKSVETKKELREPTGENMQIVNVQDNDKNKDNEGENAKEGNADTINFDILGDLEKKKEKRKKPRYRKKSGTKTNTDYSLEPDETYIKETDKSDELEAARKMLEEKIQLVLENYQEIFISPTMAEFMTNRVTLSIPIKKALKSSNIEYIYYAIGLINSVIDKQNKVMIHRRFVQPDPR